MGTKYFSEETLFVKYTRIIAVVSAYWVISISMVFINKHLLSSKDIQLDAPLFITCFQCSVALSMCIGLRIFSNFYPKIISFPELQLDYSILKKVLPLSIIFVSMITFNNLCLKYVGVAFYYIGRSLTTVFNVLMTYIILRKPTSVKAVICCAIIVIGFFMGVDQESVAGSLSVIGVIFGVVASLCVSLNSILTQKALPVVNNNIWLLTFNNNINAVLLFIPLMLVTGEFSVIYNFKNLYNIDFWIMMSLGGVFGFAIGYVTTLQIQVTSPLTHNISGTAKACAQTVLAVMWYQEMKSLLWWVSNGVVLFGSAAYTRVRQLEMVQQHRENVDKLNLEGVKTSST